MWELLGLIKALLTDLSGGFHPRRFKNPAEDLPVWRISQDIKDYKDLLKMSLSQDEMSEEQRQALLSDGEEAREAVTVLHSFSTSNEEIVKPSQPQEEELVQKGYEEVVEGPDENESSKTEVSDDSSDPIEDSYFKLGLNEEAFNESFDEDSLEDLEE